MYFTIKHDERLAEHTIKTRLDNYCPNINMGTKFVNTEHVKTNESQKFV